MGSLWENVERLGKCTPREAKVGLGRLGATGFYHNHIIENYNIQLAQAYLISPLVGSLVR